jgi:hypothetical protein
MNRRPRPIVVSGIWDCVGLLLAASGLLLVVGPALLSSGYQRFIDDSALEVRGDGEALPFGTIWALWWGVWVLYYVVVIGGAALMLWSRRNKTVIYNIEPAVFERVLLETLGNRGFEVSRLGQRIFLGRGPIPATLADPLPHVVSTSAGPRPDRSVLDIEPFPAFSHVTLHWRDDEDRVRAEVETELAKSLAGVRTRDNAAGTWLLALAGLLFGLIFLAVLAIILSLLYGVQRLA